MSCNQDFATILQWRTTLILVAPVFRGLMCSILTHWRFQSRILKKASDQLTFFRMSFLDFFIQFSKINEIISLMTETNYYAQQQIARKGWPSSILRTFDPAFAHILWQNFYFQILHHISYLLVNLGFTMPIKLYLNKYNDKIPCNKH